VIEQIRQAILFGEVRPGERLVGSDWSARLGVSATPLREAFQRLAAEGFVDYDSQRGARVAPLTTRAACEIYEIRIMLEPEAVASSVGAADAEWCDQLDRAFERLDELYTDSHFATVNAIEAHRDFHRLVRARCTSRWLLRIVDMLGDQSTRMQFAALSKRGGHRPARAEHREIYTAARGGDAKRAGALTAAHLRRTLAALELATATG
jgi:DNA-binding GntR family transcriptional regulator